MRHHHRVFRSKVAASILFQFAQYRMLRIGDIYLESHLTPANAASRAQQFSNCLFMTHPLHSLCIVQWSLASVQ